MQKNDLANEANRQARQMSRRDRDHDHNQVHKDYFNH